MKFWLIMRRWRNTDGFATLYGFVRYVPYVAFILALKVYVMMLLIHSRDMTSDYAEYDDYSAKVSSQQQKTTTTTEEPGWREKQEVLQRLNRTKLVPSATNRTPETIWLFYNRIPRTGGQTIVSLLKSLSKDLDYQHQEHVYRTPWQRLMSDEEQKNLATWFEYNFWPKSYDRFSLYINFTQHRSAYVTLRPAYITMVRDPVEKFISYFRFKRVDQQRVKMEMTWREREKPGASRSWYWKKLEDCVLNDDPECSMKDGTDDFLSAVPFICGQHSYCLKRGEPYALQKAKFHAEYEYSVIGITEEWNTTLGVLEQYLPAFFSGARQRYFSSEFQNERTVNKNPKKYKEVSAEVRTALKNRMALEYELYEFLKQRLHRQYLAVADILMKPTTEIPSRSTEKVELSNWDRLDIELGRGRKD
ncbi:heparan sulfate 2-O-sulfotransferase pipe-like isoform X1 [Macrobrachium rosenbergii]|uniref:heparan sulfate 2-O-sulfotransferase pipe-like isoform X1 n=2 Tax=Macrobrachium rosenbergii TaxID=79674 RepID=UPI0034D42D3A